MSVPLIGGYKVPYDAAAAFRALEDGRFDEAWSELWENLHHQGDVGTASYAAVPEIVRIATKLQLRGWDAYALVACIEECRLNGKNPPLPDFLEAPYLSALTKLAEKGMSELIDSNDAAVTRSILAVLAFAKGQPLIGEFAMLTQDEQEESLRGETT
jgi:hypothetical protein